MGFILIQVNALDIWIVLLASPELVNVVHYALAQTVAPVILIVLIVSCDFCVAHTAR